MPLCQGPADCLLSLLWLHESAQEQYCSAEGKKKNRWAGGQNNKNKTKQNDVYKEGQFRECWNSVVKKTIATVAKLLFSNPALRTWPWKCFQTHKNSQTVAQVRCFFFFPLTQKYHMNNSFSLSSRKLSFPCILRSFRHLTSTTYKVNKCLGT